MSKKISELTAATDVTASDLFQVVDIEDPAMASSGTNKKITAQTLGNYLPVRALGSTTSRTLSERFADTVNVKDFGAAGDGIQDDTAAIQAAMNSSNTSFLIDGRYRCTANITRAGHTKLTGNGLGASAIVFDGNYGFIFSGGSGADHYDMKHIAIQDMAFECTGLNTGAILQCSWTAGIGGTSKSLSMRNVDITGSSASGGFRYGLRLVNARNVQLENVRFAGDRDASPIATGDAISIYGDNPDGAPVEFFLDGVQAYYCNKFIDVTGWVEGLYLNKCTAIACHYGIVTAPTPSGRPLLFITNCHFNTDKFGILNLGFVQSIIQANSFYCIDVDGTSSSYVGVQFDPTGSALDSHIKDNDFQGISAIASKIGIVILNSAAEESVQISGNTMSSFNTGISLGTATSGIIVTDTNTFRSVTNLVADGGSNLVCISTLNEGGSHKEYPDGLQHKFGSSLVTLNASGDGAVSISPAFPSACLVATVCNGDSTAQGEKVFAVKASSSSGLTFSVRPNPGAVIVRVNWQMFGR